jgi:hypothetical protein
MISLAYKNIKFTKTVYYKLNSVEIALVIFPSSLSTDICTFVVSKRHIYEHYKHPNQSFRPFK